MSEATTTVGDAGRGFFPLDEQLGLEDKHYSASLVKEVVWLSGAVGSFEQAEEVLRRVGQIKLSDSTIWRRANGWGEQFQQLESEQRQTATALPKRGESAVQRPDQAGRLGTSMDGGLIFIRDEGWKELKVGAVFAVEVRPTFDRETHEWLPLPHAIHNSYTAHLGGPETFGQQLWSLAQARGWNRVRDTQVIGDGAPWIWNLAADHFYDSKQVVDYYHATQHLASAAHSLYPQDELAAQRWFTQTKKPLFQGHAAQIAQTLSQAAAAHPDQADALTTEAGYFDHHKNRMPYLELREDGYVIGSGMVESGVKQFKSRFCGPGMRWSRAGAEHLVSIRTAILSDAFDTTWHRLQISPQN